MWSRNSQQRGSLDPIWAVAAQKNVKPYWCSQCVKRNVEQNTVMRRITTFRSTMDRIYDGGPIILQYNITIHTTVLQLPAVFSTVTCCTASCTMGTGSLWLNISRNCGPGSSVGIATELPGWTVRDRIPVGTRFSARPDRPWGPPSLMYNGYRVFPGVKVRPGRAADHSLPSSAAVMEQ